VARTKFGIGPSIRLEYFLSMQPKVNLRSSDASNSETSTRYW
jgi:hypothetical protein